MQQEPTVHSPAELVFFLLAMHTITSLRKAEKVEFDKTLPVFLNNFGIILRSIWH